MKTKRIKRLDEKGQSAVLYALLLPMLIIFLFVVFDLGWIYLNQSRLQNAAEAAAIAGANKFCEEESNYNSVMLIYEEDETYKALRNSGNELSKLTSEINSAAQNSWKSNLGADPDADIDSWTKVAVSPDYKLYGETENAETIYYEVKLEENVTHIFKVLDEIFTTVPAVAVAEISKKATLAERPLLVDVLELSQTKIIGNWEEQNIARKNESKELENGFYSSAEHRDRIFYAGNWNHFQDPDAKVHYQTGDNYKTETITVSKNSTSLKATSANGGNIYSDDILDSLNLDFKQDVNITFNGVLTDDWDIGFDLTGTGIKKVGVLNETFRDNWGTAEINLRVHVTVNFDRNYETRNISNESSEDGSTEADPLYVRIESEPMVANLYGKTVTNLNSVRQIILNINETNMSFLDDEKKHDYTYRPLVIFYDGPEKNDPNSARESQPVIVNLNADFRGILSMPNSPVVLNGNGHKFQGLVIAKEFRKLKTESDYVKYIRESDGKEIYIEKVSTNTQTSGTGGKIMVRKPGTDDWFQVNQSALYYKDTYRKITVNDDLTGKNTPYVVKKTKDITTNKLDNYDTTTYYRFNASKEKIKTPAYVRKGLIHNDDYSYSDNVEIFKGTKTNWYEVKISEEEIYSIINKNSNFLFYKDGWRIITDEDNQQYITNINSKTGDVNDFIEISDYVEVVDAEGKTAYLSNFDYFIKKSDAEPLIIDRYGNVQYTDKLTSDYSLGDESKLGEEGKAPVFNPSTFGLSTNVNDTHYSRCGAIPQRRRYEALDKFATGGDYSQDMFFETERAKHII